MVESAPLPSLIGEKSKPTPFPWLLAVLNAIVLIAPGILRDNPIRAAFNLIGGIILAAGFFVLQVVAFRILRRRIPARRFWQGFVLVPCIFIGGWDLYCALPSTQIKAVLSHGRLASLPTSARNVLYSDWDGLFSGGEFLCFEASPEDIQNFLNASPSLHGISPKVYSSEFPRLRFPPDGSEPSGHADYFSPSPYAPPWFSGELRDKGRLYQIPHRGDGHYYGTVLIDDVRHVVYIYVEWS